MTHERDFEVDDETAQDWAMALQKLIKGKTQLDRPVSSIPSVNDSEWSSKLMNVRIRN